MHSINQKKKERLVMAEMIKAIDLAKKMNLELKIVTSVRSFDYYNSFFNIFGETEEPCRRILILTKDKTLEEVYDENPDTKINEPCVMDDNIWLMEYPLTVNPNKINLEEIYVKNIEF